MEKKQGGRWRLLCGGLLAMLAIVSIGARAVLGGSSARAEAPARPAASGTRENPGNSALMPGGPDISRRPGSAAPESESAGQGEIAQALPVISEASVLGLLGFAVGFATRAMIKIALLLVATYFASLQGLSALGVVHIDWQRAGDLLNTLVLNLSNDHSAWEILRDRIPGTGALAVGYLLGFRRG